jgi:hypothetical protein
MKVLIAARLSALHQGETGLDTQEREVVKWAEAHGHQVVGIAADHKTGKSHLWDRPNLRPWVTETDKLAQYDAIVAVKVDHLTRVDDEGVRVLKDWAREHGKQLLISSAEVRFPSEGVEGLLWDAYIRSAQAEWLAIQERFERMQTAKHDAGSVVGRAPWGYEIVKLEGGIKTLEPTLDGRIWVPKIFAWIAEGRTAREVSKELAANGVKSGAPDGLWHESRVISLIKLHTYSGIRQREGRSGLQVEALVSPALQDQAIAKLASRARPGASSTTQPKALLAALKCGHPDCPGEGTWPMYRINKVWYRCTGRGPQRAGCGAPMIKTDVLNNLVLQMSEYWDSREYVSQKFVSGNDAGVRLETLRSEMAEAIRTAPSAKIATVAADYSAKIAALEAKGSILPHWEDVKTGETEGEHLRSLDLDGQREYLGRKEIRAWKDGETINVTIDGALAHTGDRSLADVKTGE